MMMNSLLSGSLNLPTLLMLFGAAVLLGFLTALVFRVRNRVSQSFMLSLALLPMLVAAIIMLVNGSIGTGIAVAGAFALIRFRSVPGTAREIAAILSCMAIGLALGMGYLGVAVIVFALVAAVTLALTLSGFGLPAAARRQLRITIPENLDYNTLFDDVFAAHSVQAELTRIKTTAMGTLFDLTYEVTLPGSVVPHALLDDLRARNGNLSITIGAIPEDDTL